MIKISEMKHGPQTNKKLFIGLYCDNNKTTSKVYNAVQECTDTDEVKTKLEELDYILVETEYHPNCTTYKFANNTHLIETYYKNSFSEPLTVNIKTHGFDTPEKLAKFWKAFERLCDDVAAGEYR